MRKNIVTIILLLLICIPIKVNADEVAITNTWISGGNKVSPGEELTLSFFISFSGIQKGDPNSLGIAVIDYELIYDDTVFIVTDITSSNWISSGYKENEKYHILSMVGNEDPYKNKCVDGILYCATYNVTIDFYVKDTDKTSTDIKMGNIVVGLLEMIDQNKEYTEDDVVIITGISDASTTISIKEKEIIVDKEPSSIIENSKPNINNKIDDIIKNEEPDISYKSNNKYLSSLKIENYDIKFYKYIYNYEITVSSSVNKLNLIVEPADSKSKYKIIGADDLKKNNYKVLVEVTAENGDKNTYTINVKVEEDKETNITTSDDNKDEPKKHFKLEKKHIIIGSIIAGVILTLVIIIKFIVHIKDRKLERALDVRNKQRKRVEDIGESV